MNHLKLMNFATFCLLFSIHAIGIVHSKALSKDSADLLPTSQNAVTGKNNDSTRFLSKPIASRKIPDCETLVHKVAPSFGWDIPEDGKKDLEYKCCEGSKYVLPAMITCNFHEDPTHPVIKKIYYTSLEKVAFIPTSIALLSRLSDIEIHYTLQGTIPTELGTLTMLEVLKLKHQNLTGSLPTELGRLSRLKTMDFSDNKINGTIPSIFGWLGQLQSLSLSGNQLTGQIPSSLGLLSNLTDMLELSNNDLSGEIPSWIGSLHQLRRLRLNGNSLTGPIPSSLGSLSELRELKISFNSFEGEIPSSIGSLSKLRYLDLTKTNLSGPIPNSLSQLLKIEFMYLGNNNLTGSVPSWFKHFGNLRQLSLGQNAHLEISSEIHGLLKQLKNVSDQVYRASIEGDNASDNFISVKINELKKDEASHAFKFGYCTLRHCYVLLTLFLVLTF